MVLTLNHWCFPPLKQQDQRQAQKEAGGEEAEAFVCRNLGIIQGGQVVTEQALSEFAKILLIM
jgi:hypothetical protein